MATTETSEIGYENLKQITELTAGRAPVVEPQTWVFGGQGSGRVSVIPSLTTDGTQLNDAIWAVWGVRNWRDPKAYKAIYQIHAFGAGTFGIEFFGAAPGFVVSVADNTDAPTTVSDLKTAIDGTTKYTNSASSASGAGGSTSTVLNHTDMLELSMDFLPPFAAYSSFALEDSVLIGNTTEGVGTSSLIPEATHTTCRLWGMNQLDQWQVISALTVMGPGRFVRTKVAGFKRLFVEVTNTDGMCVPGVGQTVLERDQSNLENIAANKWTALDLGLYDTIATNGIVRGGLGLPLEREPGLYAHGEYQHHATAPQIIRQGLLATTVAAIYALPVNPARRGYLIQAQGTAALRAQWVQSSPAVLTFDPPTNFTAGGFSLADGVPRTESGDAVPSNALLIRGAVGSIWIEEW